MRKFEPFYMLREKIQVGKVKIQGNWSEVQAESHQCSNYALAATSALGFNFIIQRRTFIPSVVQL